jgi:hypothetical protein
VLIDPLKSVSWALVLWRERVQTKKSAYVHTTEETML